MNYEKIIVELGNKIAQLTIDNAVLVSRVQEEQEAKEAVERKYVEVCTELRSVKDREIIIEEREIAANEQK